ncbi:MAG TPA: signal peptidase II [Syntrophorhabdaceae bacterium]|jgi:signal peptidase II
MRRYLVFTLVPLIFVLDRWTKWLVIDQLSHMEGIHLTPFFSLVYWRNLGGAFGFLSQHPLGKYVFTIFPLLVAAALVYGLVAYRFPLLKLYSLVLILAGALGNLYDRISYGYVIDFLLFYYKGWQWPAFNVADISISTGIGLWLFAEFLILRKQKALTKSA